LFTCSGEPFGSPVRTQAVGLKDTVVATEAYRDDLGRVVAASLPHQPGFTNQGLRRFVYDLSGELTSVTEPDSTVSRSEVVDVWNVTNTYDEWFQDVDAVSATVVTLPRGNRKVSIRDHAGNVVRTFDDPAALGGATLQTRFEHGAFDLLRRVTTPKETTELIPDAIGRTQIINSSTTARACANTPASMRSSRSAMATASTPSSTTTDWVA
jgi:hypothetical protein